MEIISELTHKRMRSMDYTDDELLDLLKLFYKETVKISSQADFMGNEKYPNFKTYINHFGSWNNGLKLVKFDVDTLVQRGFLQCSYYKGRLAELIINKSFKNKRYFICWI